MEVDYAASGRVECACALSSTRCPAVSAVLTLLYVYPQLQVREAALNNKALLEKHSQLEQDYKLLQMSAEKVAEELEQEKKEAEETAAREIKYDPLLST
eukprot:scaffold69249_cov19-Prasinocladus_malaysianus.AAC.1